MFLKLKYVLVHTKENNNMILGYARVSTDEQNLDRQIDALEKNGAEKIYFEKITGRKSDRPQLIELMDYARKGDMIVITELSRLGRSTKDLILISEKLNEKGIMLKSLKENIDTNTPTGKLMFGMLAVLAEFERNVIVERVNEGIKSARERGKIGGRPKVSNDKLSLACKLYESKEYTVKEITNMTGISKATLYRELNKKTQ